MTVNTADNDRGERIWGDDWKARVRTRLYAIGFSSLEEFLVRFPAEPYLALAQKLGDDIAALQIILMQFSQAEGKELRKAAMDCLTREINGHLKKGWGNGVRVEFQTARVFANWAATITRYDPGSIEKLEKVWRALNNLRPPQGWLPDGLHDPFIVAAFADGWPCNNAAGAER